MQFSKIKNRRSKHPKKCGYGGFKQLKSNQAKNVKKYNGLNIYIYTFENRQKI